MNTHRPARVLSRAISRAISHSSSSSSSSSSSLQQQSSTFPLKNVTKSNFEPALADLRRHVAAEDFVAIDLEMTGITSAPWRTLWSSTAPTSATSRSRTRPRSSPCFSSAFAPSDGTPPSAPSLLIRTISTFFLVKSFRLQAQHLSFSARLIDRFLS
ncbi:hypothetical protein TB2_028458 [Malus domestica]